MTSTKLLIKRSIKSAASVARATIGFAPGVAPGSVNIIAYHRVVADIAKAEREAIYGLSVSTATFRKHCELLKKSFDVVSLETARYFLNGDRKVKRPLAALTFDDGYLDFYEEAFPVLNEFGLPATVFLPTSFIGKDKPLAHDRIYWLVKQALEKSVSLAGAMNRAGVPSEITKEFERPRDLLRLTDLLVHLPNDLREKIIHEMERELGDKFIDYPREYQLLNWEMVREMSRKGINFGAHTANHVVLPLENEQAIEAEIAGSKKALETELGSRVVSFAYPNGEYNARVKQFVARAGFQVAVTTEKKINHPGADLFALGRTSLCEESTRGIAGSYSPGVADLRLGI
jgi:peptidoglycan/xylan/chitin deacetylase (PgdA/CDA1 family)